MAVSTSAIYIQTFGNPSKRLQNADGTALVTVYTASANSAVIKGFFVTSTDTADVNLKVVINDGATDFLLGTVRIPAGSGTDGALPNVDVLGSPLLQGLPFDNKGKRCLTLKNGYILKVGALAAVTATKQVDVITAVEEY